MTLATNLRDGRLRRAGKRNNQGHVHTFALDGLAVPVDSGSPCWILLHA